MQESRLMAELSRRAMLLFGSGLAVFGLGNLDGLDAEAKKRKRRRRKNKKRKKGKGGFTVVALDMTDDKEVPGPEDPPDEGDPLGQGSGECTIKGNEICCKFEFTTTTPNSDVSGVHIHEGPPDEDGPIVVDFEGQLDNCVIADDGIAAQIKNNPEDFYANIHTDAHPSGAVRDQLQAKS